MFRQQTCGAEEQPGEVRRHPAARIGERRAVAKPEEGEELIQLAIAVNRERSLAQISQRQLARLDDWREYDSHAYDASPGRLGTMLRPTVPVAPPSTDALMVMVPR